MAKPLIALSGVGMTYQAASGPVEALAGISLSVEAGEFVSLVGPSGCGKSTLLRIVAGLRPATAGAVTVGGVVSTVNVAVAGDGSVTPCEVVERTSNFQVALLSWP